MWNWTFFLFAVGLALVQVSTGQNDSQKRRKVIVDVDAGTDDSMALFLLLSKRSTVDVIAITCVSGNTGLSNVTRNVLKTLAVANRLDIPVYTGSPQGLVYAEVTDSFWGDDGFGDFSNSYPVDLTKVKEGHSAIALAELVKKYPGEITILALGPLTNIALAGHLVDNFFDLIDHLVILGGSYQGSGNVKPGVEFNIYADPEAAAYVFARAKENHSVIIVPMETIERAGLPMNFRTNILGKVKGPVMEFLNKAEGKAMSKMGSQWLYFDQTAAAIVVQPDIVDRYIKRKIIIESHGTNARGAMFIDNKATIHPITIITLVNTEKIKKLFLNNLAS